ncbi:MAG: hypothetical protein LBH72_07775 [Proteiniphilum sp.]|jgi:hypothetical protein|nr:hypothetical protein [Proteiniphilum sp.]
MKTVNYFLLISLLFGFLSCSKDDNTSSDDNSTEKYADYALCDYNLENVHYDFYLAYTTAGEYDDNNIEVQYYPNTAAYFNLSDNKCEIVCTNSLIMKAIKITVNEAVQQGGKYDIMSKDSNVSVLFSAGAGTGAFDITQRETATAQKIGEVVITSLSANRIQGTFYCQLKVGAIANGKFSLKNK